MREIRELGYQPCAVWPALAAVDGGFGAPLGGEEADCLIDAVVEAEEVADYALVEVGAVGVGVGELLELSFYT